MLTTTRIHQPWALDVLFDDGQWCPICHNRAFTYLEGSGITCNTCGAAFELRYTAGDPGVVIDCWGDPNGKYAAQAPAAHGTLYYFWQVVKECEAGLDDRQRWCSHSTKYLTDYRADDPLLFAEVFYFEPYETAKQQAHDRWRRTPTGKRLTAELQAARPKPGDQAGQKTQVEVHARYALISHPADEDAKAAAKARAAWDAYYEVLRQWQSKLWEYERLHVDDLMTELRSYKTGLYFAEQCEKTWPQDGFWLHRCLPKAGAEPRVRQPLYEGRPHAGAANGGDAAKLRQHLQTACDALGQACQRLSPDPVVDTWLQVHKAAQTYLVEEEA